MNTSKTISLIDYGAGNIGSIANMIAHVGGTVRIVKTPEDLNDAQKILLPGIGAFAKAMQLLRDQGFIPAITKKVMQDKVPTLGICLGMQVLTEYSEEGDVPGLGFIKGCVRKFQFAEKDASLKVPHISWQKVTLCKKSRLFPDSTQSPRFYFVHSYKACDILPDQQLLTCNYGGPFVAGFEHENIVGVQFHPEKSSLHGMNFFKNFLENF